MSLTKELEDRMLAQGHRIDRLVDEFGALKLLLEKNNTSLEEFIALAKGFKFGLKILGHVERAAVFVTKITLAAGSMWAIWKFAVREAIQQIGK